MDYRRTLHLYLASPLSFGAVVSVVIMLLGALLMAAPETFAQSAMAVNPPAAPTFGQRLMGLIPLLAMVSIVFYLMVVRPQQSKLKSQEDLLTSLKKGDSVVTSAGIVGKIAALEDKYILLDTGNNTRIRFERAHIVRREVSAGQEKSAA